MMLHLGFHSRLQFDLRSSRIVNPALERSVRVVLEAGDSIVATTPRTPDNQPPCLFPLGRHALRTASRPNPGGTRFAAVSRSKVSALGTGSILIESPNLNRPPCVTRMADSLGNSNTPAARPSQP